jgi:hypothetical protein
MAGAFLVERPETGRRGTMFRFALASVATLALGALVFAGTVVVPKDTKAFDVQQSETVRLSSSGIAGSSIKATVSGPAKIEHENTIREVTNGRVLIGNTTTEFDLKPTGKGKVTVKITVASPTGGGPRTTEYEFTVK